MSRKSLAIGLMMSCMVVLLGIGKAEAASPKMISAPHQPGELHPEHCQGEKKKSSGPAIVTEDGPLKGIITPENNQYLGIP